MCGTIKQTIWGEGGARDETQLEFYKMMAVLAFMYVNETWVLAKRSLQV
jgi:hypothetical protein